MYKKNESLVTAICRQTTIPKNATIIRLPGTGNARPSAIAPPFAKPVLNWSTPPAAALQLLPPDEAVVIVTNDPLHAMLYTDKNNAGAALSQLWLWGGSPDNPSIFVSPGGKPNLATDLYSATPTVGSTQFHGPRVFPILHKGKYFMWCDAPQNGGAATCALQIYTGSIPMAAGDAVNITIFRLGDGDEVQAASVRIPGPFAANALAYALTLPTADYYRVELQGDDDNVTALLSFVIQNVADSEILVHRALPDLVERMMPLVQAIRVIGAASHALNLVSDQNATGSWVGDQPEGSLLWTMFLRGVSGANGFQRLTTQRGNEVMELKKFNPYTWVAPENEQSWAYQHPFAFNSTGVSNVIGREIMETNYTIVYLKSGGTGAGADISRNIQLEFFFAVEYLSEGLWMMPGVSPATNDDEDAARKVLNSMENITHNPAFDEIMKTIGKYVRLSAPVLALLGPYGKAASAVATGVGEGLRILGYRTKQRAREDGAYTGLLPLKKRRREADDVEDEEEEGGEDV